MRTWSLRKRGSALLLLALLVSAPLAVAAEGEPTREEYVAQVDLICKKNEKSNSRILKGVRQQIAKKHQFVPAGKRFLKAAKSFGRAVKEIVGVPQPSADEVKLKKWIKYLHLERSQLQRIGQALKRKLGGKANHIAVQLHQTNRKANNTVFSFEFQYCDREANFG